MDFGDSSEVFVGRQHREIVADAELCEQGIDGCDPEPVFAALIAQVGGVHVIATIGNEEGQRAEALDDSLAVTGLEKTLQQLLQDEPGGEYLGAAFERLGQVRHLGAAGRRVATQGQRPDAGIDKQVHRRERSAL